MSEAAAGLIWTVLGVYMMAGLLVALYVLLFALGRLNSDAATMPFRVRVLVLPGLMALWPLALARLWGARAIEDARPEVKR